MLFPTYEFILGRALELNALGKTEKFADLRAELNQAGMVQLDGYPYATNVGVSHAVRAARRQIAGTLGLMMEDIVAHAWAA